MKASNRGCIIPVLKILLQAVLITKEWTVNPELHDRGSNPSAGLQHIRYSSEDQILDPLWFSPDAIQSLMMSLLYQMKRILILEFTWGIDLTQEPCKPQPHFPSLINRGFICIRSGWQYAIPHPYGHTSGEGYSILDQVSQYSGIYNICQNKAIFTA